MIYVLRQLKLIKHLINDAFKKVFFFVRYQVWANVVCCYAYLIAPPAEQLKQIQSQFSLYLTFSRMVALDIECFFTSYRTI